MPYDNCAEIVSFSYAEIARQFKRGSCWICKLNHLLCLFAFFQLNFLPFQNVTLTYLAKKCRNEKYQTSLRAKNKLPNADAESNQPAASQSNSTKITENDLDFFKSVVVAAENMELIKQKLKLTAEFRAKQIKKIKVDYLEKYPILYTHPILVI